MSSSSRGSSVPRGWGTLIAAGLCLGMPRVEKYDQADSNDTTYQESWYVTHAGRLYDFQWLAPMNPGADEGAMPAKVSENMRPTVIAGLAKLVDEVKKYAAVM